MADDSKKNTSTGIPQSQASQSPAQSQSGASAGSPPSQNPGASVPPKTNPPQQQTYQSYAPIQPQGQNSGGYYQPASFPPAGGYAPQGGYPPQGGFPPTGSASASTGSPQSQMPPYYAPAQPYGQNPGAYFPPAGGYSPQGGYPPAGFPPQPEDTTPANFQLGTKFPPKLKVKAPKNTLKFDEEYFIRLLAGSISLSKDEKKRIVESIPKLKQTQIDELIHIFEEEKQKFAALSRRHVPQLEKLAEQHYQEWMQLEDEFEQSHKKAEDQGKAEAIRKSLGL